MEVRDGKFRLLQQNVGETAYLVADMGEQLKMDTFALKMMAHNHMVNIIQAQVVYRDDQQFVQFDITGLMKLSGWLARPRVKKDVLFLFNSLANAFEEVDAYMLDMKHLLLDWEYVYLDRQGNCMLLYLPFDHMFQKDQIVFLQEIVGRVQPDYQERDTYLFDILNAFSRDGIRKLSDFREILKKSTGISGTAPEWHSQEKEPASAGQENVAMAAPPPQGIGRGMSSGGTEKGVLKKAPSGSRIPVVNIPGREPGGKAVVPIPVQGMSEREGNEAIGTGKGSEKKEKRKKETEKKASSKEGKKGFFKRDGKKQDASQKQSAFGKQNAFLIPGKRKTGQSDDAGGEYQMQPETSGNIGSAARDKLDGLYESYENTVMMPEPASMTYANGQAGGYAGMQTETGVPTGQGNMAGTAQTVAPFMAHGNETGAGQMGILVMAQGNVAGTGRAGMPMAVQGDMPTVMQGGSRENLPYTSQDAGFYTYAVEKPYQSGLNPYAADVGMRGNMSGMEEDEECTMMLEQPELPVQPAACLIRRRDGAVYRMERERVMVGSGTAADICIYDNHAVSRNHAVLSHVNGEYYLEDNQSKNGSFINGRRLQPGVREAVYDGMILKFANEDFVFSKYGR